MSTNKSIFAVVANSMLFIFLFVFVIKIPYLSFLFGALTATINSIIINEYCNNQFTPTHTHIGNGNQYQALAHVKIKVSRISDEWIWGVRYRGSDKTEYVTDASRFRSRFNEIASEE